MNGRLEPALLFGAVLLAAVSAGAREVLTPEEQAERELEKKRAAPPVLVCQPTALSITVARGETRALRLSIRNAGGRVLSWAVISAPKWITPDRRAGELGFEKKRSLVLTIDPEHLPAGGTTGSVVIEARDENEEKVEGSPVTVRVTVEIPVEAPVEAPEAVPAEEGPPPRPVAEAPPTRPTRAGPLRPDAVASPKRFGVRAGYMGYGQGTEVKLGASPLLGVYLGRDWLKGIRYEVGLDVARSEAANESFVSTLVGGRLDILFPLGNGQRSTRAYLLSGVEGLVESIKDVNTSSTNSATAVNLGAGLGFGRGRFDLRATYSLFLGSDNAAGMTLVSAAFLF